MATEADIPEPASLLEKGVNRHSTPEDFNQVYETADYFVKSGSISSKVEAVHGGFQGNAAVTAGESFLESPSIAKVHSEETSIKQETIQANDMQCQAEKEMKKNEKQIQKDENLKATEEAGSKENEVVETEEIGENNERSCEISDSKGVSLKMVKVEEPCLNIGQAEISKEEKISNLVKENQKITEKEASSLQNDDEDRKKDDEDAELKTSKEPRILEATSGQNEETLTHILDLKVHDLDIDVETSTDDFLKNEHKDHASSIETTPIEENIGEENSGVEEKEADITHSLPNKEKSLDAAKITEKIESDKESIRDEVNEEASSILAASLEIKSDREVRSAIIENVENKLENPSMALGTESSSIQDAGIKVGNKLEETSSIARKEESQDTMNLNGNIKDVTTLMHESQKNQVDILSVTQTEEMCLQIVDKTEMSRVVTGTLSEDVVERSPQEGYIEILEKTADADSSSGEDRQNINGEQVVTESSVGESRDNCGHTTIASENNISDAVTAPEHSKDKIGDEKIETSAEMVSEEISVIASSECSNTITCAKEDPNNGESFDKKEKGEKSIEIDAITDDEIPKEENLPSTKPKEKLEIEELQISNKIVDEYSLERGKILVEAEEQREVPSFEPQDHINEDKKSVDVGAIKDYGMSKEESLPPTELSDKIEIAEVEIQVKKTDESTKNPSLGEETATEQVEQLQEVFDFEPQDQLKEEGKSIKIIFATDDGIPKEENFPSTKPNEKLEIEEIQISNKTVDEYSMEQGKIQAQGEELREVSSFEPQDQFDEDKKSVDVAAIKDDGMSKEESLPVTEPSDEIEIAEFEIQRKKIDESTETHSLGQETITVQVEQLQEVSDFEPQDQLKEEKSIKRIVTTDDGITKEENLPSKKPNEKLEIEELQIPNKTVDEYSLEQGKIPVQGEEPQEVSSFEPEDQVDEDKKSVDVAAIKDDGASKEEGSPPTEPSDKIEIAEFEIQDMTIDESTKTHSIGQETVTGQVKQLQEVSDFETQDQLQEEEKSLQSIVDTDDGILKEKNLPSTEPNEKLEIEELQIPNKNVDEYSPEQGKIQAQEELREVSSFEPEDQFNEDKKSVDAGAIKDDGTSKESLPLMESRDKIEILEFEIQGKKIDESTETHSLGQEKVTVQVEQLQEVSDYEPQDQLKEGEKSIKSTVPTDYGSPKEKLPSTEPNENIQIAEVEIQNKNVFELSATNLLEHEMVQAQVVELQDVCNVEPKVQINEEKLVDIEAVKDDRIPRETNVLPTKLNEIEIAKVEIKTKNSEELKAARPMEQEIMLREISSFELQDQGNVEEKSVDDKGINSDEIPKVEILPPLEINEKIEIAEAEIPKENLDESNVTHLMEKETLQAQGEEMQEVSKVELQNKVEEEDKLVDLDVGRDDAIQKEESLPPLEINEKIEIAEVEIRKENLEDLNETHLVEQETLPAQSEELQEVLEAGSSNQMEEKRKSKDVDVDRDDLIPKEESSLPIEINEKIEITEVDIQKENLDESNVTHLEEQETLLAQGEELQVVSKVKPQDHVEEEEKSVDVDAGRDDVIPKEESLPPLDKEEKTEIAEAEIRKENPDEPNVTHLEEQEILLIQGEELEEVSKAKHQDYVEEEKLVHINARKDVVIPKEESLPPLETNENIEIVEAEIQKENLEELNNIHLMEQETLQAQGEEMQEVSKAEPQDHVEEEEKSVDVDTGRNDAIPKEESLPPPEIEEETKIAEAVIRKENLDEPNITHLVEEETLLAQVEALQEVSEAEPQDYVEEEEKSIDVDARRDDVIPKEESLVSLETNEKIEIAEAEIQKENLEELNGTYLMEQETLQAQAEELPIVSRVEPQDHVEEEEKSIDVDTGKDDVIPKESLPPLEIKEKTKIAEVEIRKENLDEPNITHFVERETLLAQGEALQEVIEAEPRDYVEEGKSKDVDAGRDDVSPKEESLPPLETNENIEIAEDEIQKKNLKALNDTHLMERETLQAQGEEMQEVSKAEPQDHVEEEEKSVDVDTGRDNVIPKKECFPPLRINEKIEIAKTEIQEENLDESNVTHLVKQETLAAQDEEFQEISKEETKDHIEEQKSVDVDAGRDDAIPKKESLPPLETKEKIEIAEAEIQNENLELNGTHLREDETLKAQGEELQEVSIAEPQDHAEEEEKSVDVDTGRDNVIPKKESLPPLEINEKTEIAEAAVQNENLDEPNVTHLVEQETLLAQGEEFQEIYKAEPHNHVEEEEKSIDIEANRDGVIPREESMPSLETNEKVEIAEAEIQKDNLEELNATHLMEQEILQEQGKELQEVFKVEPQDHVEEEEKSVDVGAVRDDVILKEESLPPQEINEKIEIAEAEIQKENLDEPNVIHLVEQETLLAQGEELQDVYKVEPQDHTEEEEKSVDIDAGKDVVIPKEKSLLSLEINEKIEAAENKIQKENLEELNRTHLVEKETLLAKGEELQEVSKVEPPNQVEEKKNPVDIAVGKDDVIPKPESVPPLEITEKIEIAEDEIQKENLDESNVTHLLEQETLIAQGEKLQEVSKGEPQYQFEVEEKLIYVDSGRDNVIPEEENVPSIEPNKRNEIAKFDMENKDLDESNATHLVEQQTGLVQGEVLREVSSFESQEQVNESNKLVRIDEMKDDRILKVEGLSPTKSNEKIQITNVEIQNKNVDQSNVIHLMQQETVPAQGEGEELQKVIKVEHQDQVNEEEKLLDIDVVRDDGIPIEKNVPPTKQEEKREIAKVEIENKDLDESNRAHSMEQQTVLEQGEELREVSSFEIEEQVNEEDKSIGIKATEDEGIPKLENFPPTERNGKIQITEINIQNRNLDELTATSSMEQEAIPAQGEELQEVSNAELEDQVNETEKINIDVVRDYGIPKEESVSSTEQIEKIEIVEVEIGKKIVDGSNTAHSMEKQTILVQGEELQEVSAFDPQDQVNEEDKLLDVNTIKDDGIPKSLPPGEMNEQIEVAEVEIQNILAETSHEEKKEDGCLIKTDEDNDRKGRLQEDNKEGIVENPQIVDGISHEMDQNDESLNSRLRASLGTKPECLQCNNFTTSEPSPIDEKDDIGSSVKTDEENKNNAGSEELKVQNEEEKLKHEKDIEKILQEIEPGENVEQQITVLSVETEAIALNEVDTNSKKEIVETPQGNPNEAELPKEVDKNKEHSTDEHNIQSLSREYVKQGMVKNFHNDEINVEISNKEIFLESLTNKTGEIIVLETNQNNEISYAPHPTSAMQEEESLKHKGSNITAADILPKEKQEGDESQPEEKREANESTVKAGEVNDSNTELLEILKSKMETSQSEANREPKLQKNEPEDFELSTTVITAEIEAIMLSEKANNITIVKEVGAIQNVGETVKNEKNEGIEDIENNIKTVPTREDVKPDAETCAENISVDTEILEAKSKTSEMEGGIIENIHGFNSVEKLEGKHTSGNAEEEIKNKGIEEEHDNTTIACLSEDTEKYITTEALSAKKISPQSTGEITASIYKEDKEEKKSKMEMQELELTNIVKETENEVSEEATIARKQSTEPAMMHEIIQSAKEDGDTGKLMVEEGIIIEDKFKAPVNGIDEENPSQKKKEGESDISKLKEQIKGFNSESTEVDAGEKHEIQNEALIATSYDQNEMNVSEASLGKLSDDNLMEFSKKSDGINLLLLSSTVPLGNLTTSSKDSELINSEESQLVDESSSKYPIADENKEMQDEDEITIKERVYESGSVDTGIENTNKEARSYQREDPHQDLELHNEQIISKTEDAETTKMEQTRDLIDQGDICKSKISQDEEPSNVQDEDCKCIELINTDKKEPAQEKEDSAKKPEARSENHDVGKEAAGELEAGTQKQGLEDREAKNNGMSTEQVKDIINSLLHDITMNNENFESAEPSKTFDCAFGILTRDESNETVCETNQNIVEENRISESAEQRYEKSQEIQQDPKEKPEPLGVEDLKETQDAYETVKATILTEEMCKEVEKPDDDEVVKHFDKEENDIEQLHISTENERIDEVKEFSSISTEYLGATDSNKGAEKENAAIEAAQNLENEASVTEENDERTVEDEGSEKFIGLSTSASINESEEKIKEEITENADSCYDKIKAKTVMQETAEPNFQEVPMKDKPKQDTNIPLDKSSPHADEPQATQQESIAIEENSLAYESKNDDKEELHTGEIGEEIKEASEIVNESQDYEPVTGNEIATYQTLPKEITNENERQSPAMPCKEDHYGTKATTENVEENIEKVIIIKDEASENSSVLKTTEERCLQHEDSRDFEFSQLELHAKESMPNSSNQEHEKRDEFKEDLKEVSKTAMKTSCHNLEAATEDEVANDHTQQEEKSEELHQTEPFPLLSKEHELVSSTTTEKMEENIKELLLEDETKTTEEVHLQKEASGEFKVSQLDLELNEDVKEGPKKEPEAVSATSVEIEQKKEASESQSHSNAEDNRAIKEDEISSIQTNLVEKLEAQKQTLVSALLSKEQEVKISDKIESIEENREEMEMLEYKSKGTEEILLKGDHKELEFSLLESQLGKDAQMEHLNEIHERKDGATEGTKEIKEISELVLDISSQDHTEAKKDEITSNQTLTTEKEKDQNETPPTIFLLKDHEHGKVNGHEAIMQSEEAEIKEEHTEAATMDLITEENLREKTIATEIMHDEVTNERMTEEKDDARNCEEKILGEGAARESCQEHEVKGEASLEDKMLAKQIQIKESCKEIEKTIASETLEEQIGKGKETLENLHHVFVDSISSEAAIAKKIQQQHEIKGEESQGDKLYEEIENTDASEKIGKQIITEKGIVENLHPAVENILREEAAKEIHQGHETKGEESHKMLAKEIENEVSYKEIEKTDASETVEKYVSIEKGKVENLHQTVAYSVSSEKKGKEVHQEQEIKGKENEGGNMLATEIQDEALFTETGKTDASETTEKEIITEKGTVENLHQAVAENKTIEEHFLEETGSENAEEEGRKSNIENQVDETRSGEVKTKATTAIGKELAIEISKKGAAELAETTETNLDIHQGEKPSDGTLNHISREVEPETMISSGKKDVPWVLQEQVGETTQVTEVGGSQPANATVVNSEGRGLEHRAENIVDEKDGKAMQENTSKDSAKLSFFDMTQRSTTERQVAGELTEEKEPAEIKEEVEVAKQIEQTEKAKSDEEEEEEEEGDEQKKNDSGSDALVIVEELRDIDVKVVHVHKKSHNILSGVGSKVKHSISKVKKAITGKSSHSKQQSPK